MTAVAFDTLKFARALRDKAQMTNEQAESLTDALAEAMRDDLATKMDVRESELRLENKIEATKSDIIKWMFGTIGFQTLIILGAVIALARLIHP